MTLASLHHRQRSEFIRALVQQPVAQPPINDARKKNIPKVIVQYWDDSQGLPADIEKCIESWSRWTTEGFSHRLFDERSAKEFISDSLSGRHECAFANCYHPAMQADYFRLCYLLVEGGFYVDADDVCIGGEISWLFEDGRLKLQPLCYDIAVDSMVTPAVFLKANACKPNWIFYFNNNPLVARRGHPIIERALKQATDALQRVDDVKLPEIQETTGPGNLSESIFKLGNTLGEVESDLVVLKDWESLAVSKWPLSYRDDARNWRHSNQQKYFNKE